MYLWRSLPEGQLAAVLEWIFLRRRPQDNQKAADKPAAVSAEGSWDKPGELKEFPIERP